MDDRLQRLQEKLKEFGLNPREWAVTVHSYGGGVQKLMVCHRVDGDLVLEGWASRDHWLSLQVQG